MSREEVNGRRYIIICIQQVMKKKPLKGNITFYFFSYGQLNYFLNKTEPTAHFLMYLQNFSNLNRNFFFLKANLLCCQLNTNIQSQTRNVSTNYFY